MIVDDDPHNRLLLTTLLHHAGHDVTEAATGIAGHLTAQALQPDLIVVDLSLPDISGVELIRRLRADERTSGVRIALYTATHAPDALDELAETFGVVGVIPKPADPQRILDAFSRLLQP